MEEDKRFHTGTKVEFTCNQGFEMLGENITECRRNRQWTAEMPECKEIIIVDPDEGKIFTPFVLVLTVLVGLFLLNIVLLALWLKFRGPWAPIPEDQKVKDPLEDDLNSEKIKTVSESVGGSDLSDDVFESVDET